MPLGGSRCVRLLPSRSRKMHSFVGNAHRRGGGHVDLDYLFGRDPADAWTRRRAATRMERTQHCPTCSVPPAPQTCQPTGALTVTGSGDRGGRRRRSAVSEAVVDAPDPAVDDHGLNGNSPSVHLPAPATVVDAATQHAAQSSREWLPEDFELAVGEVSTVHRAGLDSPADVFRCAGCSVPECQVSRCRRCAGKLFQSGELPVQCCAHDFHSDNRCYGNYLRLTTVCPHGKGAWWLRGDAVAPRRRRLPARDPHVAGV